LLDSTSDRSRHKRVAIAERLERVRGNLTDAEFAQLVEDVARTAERFDEIDALDRARMTPNLAAPPTPRKPSAPL
jgi:hypothetical protein